MRRVVLGIVFYLLAIVVVSAVLTPLAAWGTEALGWHFPVKRVFNRTIMVSALLLLWPLVKFLRINSWRQCGLAVSGPALARVPWWLALGIFTIVVLYLGQWLAGVVVWDAHLVWYKPLGFLLTGLLVGVLEELMFRGVFFLAFASEDKGRTLLLAVLGSAFFATAHFIKAQNPAGEVNWLTGWLIWAEMGSHFLVWQELVMRWLTLFWTGMMLCAVSWRYGTIWAAVGLHAGWVLALKTAEGLVRTQAASGSVWFAPSVLEGLWPALLLMVMCGVTLTVKFSREG
ncbi:MAG: CPBP family intramembrane metalloprotease, partial [Verrucomicrobiales bacterium]|nr:CPBP family intramembrane metalloprotease [Verrucomicrobiales bacterium]